MQPLFKRALRWVLPLLVALGVLTWAVAASVTRLSRSWFERDLGRSAEIAVGAARQAIVAPWRASRRAEVRASLEELARGELVLGAAACGVDGATVAATRAYPAHLSCASMASRFAAGEPLHETRETGQGAVLVSAVPVQDDTGPLGFVVMAHDLGYVARRESITQRIYMAGFAALALLAAATTMLMARSSYKGWLEDVRDLVRSGSRRDKEFQPLLRDLRQLAAQLTTDAEAEAVEQEGGWTAGRLKRTLRQHLRGERVVAMANREPYVHHREPDGTLRVLHPASGLVTALEPVMRACSGTWVAHGSGSGDREASDVHGRVVVPPAELEGPVSADPSRNESYVLRRVWLSEEEERGYYYGFANEGLWPLCHIAYTRPVFRREDYQHYVRVNRRFADAVCDEVDSDDPIVLVQDYHFALAPQMIRRRLPRATILTFWHIPWPNAERYGICPWHEELIAGLLGSSILGFHTQAHCNNFLDAVDRYLEARIDREHVGVVHHGRETLVRAYPISIEWPSRWLEGIPTVSECRRSVLEELRLPPTTLLGVGIDRVDYTKGIEERFLAVERLLERYPAYRGRFVFVQLGAPSRTAIGAYRDLGVTIQGVAERINARFGRDGYRPIVLSREHHEPPAVFRHLRAADVCYVSSLHDGMNLVAKEFIAARDDCRGVLVLSKFTGAARELVEALIVNPYDIEEASSALATALAMSPDEQEERMRAMRALVSEYNVYRWAGRMLVDASRLRQSDRLLGRLSGNGDSAKVTPVAAGRLPMRWSPSGFRERTGAAPPQPVEAVRRQRRSR